jgi:predicted short-subunit dehydrogenase-like oxidoreductase (DUF2520 family)
LSNANRKKKVAVVGIGSLGRVLALALHAAGYAVTEIIGRDAAKSRRQAEGLALAIGARPATLDSATLDADVIWFCVPDDAIAATARQLALKQRDLTGKTVLHSSGALPASELAQMKKRGASIASAHPMDTYVSDSKPCFEGTPFALEGDAAALRTAEGIVRDLNGAGEVIRITPKQKALYHALGSFSSPLLVSLLSAAEQVAKKAGITRPQAVTGKILRQTIENYLQKGADESFSGPIKRGDIATIKKHLLALKNVPAARAIYIALAKNAVATLPVKRAAELRKLLKT